MAANSAIEWTERTWNPLAGCKEISPGCTNCYAALMAHRLEAMGQKKYEGTTKKLPNGKVVWTGKINLDEGVLREPLRRRKPTMYFVNSMSDLFHEDVPDHFIAAAFCVMESCYWHTFQVLTKRADRMQRLLSHPHFPMLVRKAGYDWLGPRRYNERGPHWRMNQWLGVSVENQEQADERIPLLRRTPAQVRFLSCEPLLGDLGISRWLWMNSPRVAWVIVGGESGPGARPCDVAWISGVVEQCKEAGVSCFVKQLGSHVICRNDEVSDWLDACSISLEDVDTGGVRMQGDPVRVRLRDRKGGDPEEWPEDLRVREFPR